MTPPDSGAREAAFEWAAQLCWEWTGTRADLVMAIRAGPQTEEAARIAEYWKGSGLTNFARQHFPEIAADESSVSLPLSLAQRILAALESMQHHASGAEFRALARELRTRLVTK